jgi:hypothetical protein
VLPTVTCRPNPIKNAEPLELIFGWIEMRCQIDFEKSNIFLSFGYMHISEPPQKWLCCPLFKQQTKAINKYHKATQQASRVTSSYSPNLAPVVRCVFPCVYSCCTPLPCFDGDALCRRPRKVALHDVLSSRAAACKLPIEGEGYDAGRDHSDVVRVVSRSTIALDSFPASN